MDLHTQLFDHNADRSLFGLPIQQSHAAILVYEQLLREYRNRIHWIVEIGTGSGALSLFWALWGRTEGWPVYTVDVRDTPASASLRALRATVRQGDCFEQPTYDEICGWIGKTPGLLVLDGGDKPEELKTFAPLADMGTIVVVHDYGNAREYLPYDGPPPEISGEDVDSVPEVRFLQPWHDASLALGTKAAVLERI